jgi:hypothetical protein
LAFAVGNFRLGCLFAISDPEAQSYAVDFARIFKELGYNIIFDGNVVAGKDDDSGIFVGDKRRRNQIIEISLRIFDTHFRIWV